MSVIGAAWRQLTYDAKSGGDGWLIRRIFPSAAVNIFAGLRMPDESPALILEVPGRFIPANVDYPQARGFEVIPQLLKAGLASMVRLCLVITDRQFGDLFEILADDVALSVAKCDNEGAGIRSFLARLRVWQGFMSRYRPNGMTEEEQIGLLGELWFLWKFVLPRLAAREAIAAWQGPIGGLQDFAIDGRRIEIKTSARESVLRIHIGSLEQLDESPLEALILAQVAIAPKIEEGQSLVDIVEEVRSQIRGEDLLALDSFNSLLLEAGYFDGQKSFYSERKFTLRSVRFFLVADVFPRIRPIDVAQGVLACSYDISFVSCLPFEIEEEEAMSVFSEGLCRE